jgi:15-cis-phytoene synthase / lycopene beta-cyclase
MTNVLIVFGLIAFDNALAVLQAFPSLFPIVPPRPSPVLLIRALLTPTREYDLERIAGMQQALSRLRAKSRSFYLASSVFEGRLRIDLILLYAHHLQNCSTMLILHSYSFCRVADDLVDNATSIPEAENWIHQLTRYLDICYSNEPTKVGSRKSFICANFPENCQAALTLLPTSYLSPAPLYDLLKGFETDLHFFSPDVPFPIHDETTLETYGSRVAGTVAELCIELVYYHTNAYISTAQRQDIIQSGGRMGVALQYVNIARDIAVDASIGRVYLPSSWLKEEDLGPKDIISDPRSSKTEIIRQRLLDNAMAIYSEARDAIEQLPVEARGPMRVAVESYVEIGRVLRKPGYKVKAGRATVPKLRRLRVAWNALRQ